MSPVFGLIFSYFGDIFDCASDRLEYMPLADAALIAAPRRTPFSVSGMRTGMPHAFAWTEYKNTWLRIVNCEFTLIK